MSRGARDPRQPVTVKWDPTTLLLSFIGSDDDLPIAGFASDSAPSVLNSLVDAKGDLIAASADNTPARLAVGSDGDALVADSTQTSGLAYSQTAQPNLVLNSDFGRRTVFGLAMPEVFSDTSGYVVVAGAPTVAANILTQNAANNEVAWCNQSFVWRDGRASATVKAVSTTGVYALRWRIDSNNYLESSYNGTNFILVKDIAGVRTTVATVVQALTLNRWYWFELERQGTTVIVKMYDTGGTVSGVTKASSTLLQTLSGTVSDSAVAVGAHISVTSDQATAQWGGIATGNGGVYVETWLPESWPVDFGGTLGGQAIGYNEGTDGGPVGRQNNLKAYIPATSRSFTLRQNSDSSPTRRASTPVQPSTTYTQSIYVKTTGASGAGLLNLVGQTFDSALANVASPWTNTDVAEVAWTRKTVVATTDANARFTNWFLQINPNVNRTGTVEFQLPQLERGGVATAWRNAPADDAPIVWQLLAAVTAFTTTSTSFSEVDARDYAINAFLPWDAMVTATVSSQWNNNTASDGGAADVFAAGSSMSASGDGTAFMLNNASTAALQTPLSFTTGKRLAAGKTRLALNARAVTGGTLAVGVSGRTGVLTITAYRGK